jgi:hypothetical protein
MQFLPSTWASYGPATSTIRRRRSSARRGVSARPAAAFRYNCSAAYVDAVERYAGRIRRSERAFRQYDARPLVVRTPVGYRRRAPASKQGQVGSHRGLSRRLCLHTAAPGLSPASTL